MKVVIVEENEVLLDDEDFDYIVGCYDLSMSGNYVYCSPKEKYRGMGLHSKQLQKVLMNPLDTGRSINVDHIDGNEMNNQKSNLRVCTHQENSRNRKPTKSVLGENPTSKYKGVYWDKQSSSWRAFINLEKDKFGFIGKFTNEIAAANCYNYYASNNFGEFAKLNECPYMSYDEWNSYRCLKNKTSKYIGVSLVDGKYLAQIYHEGKNIRIGSFIIEDRAAEAYNAKAIELKGDKAKLNKI